MSKKIYDIKTGKEYEYIESSTEEVTGLEQNGNKVIINKNNVVYENEINNFKKIFKLLCKRGEIQLENEKYTERGETYWDGGIGSTSVTDYLKTTLSLDNKVLLKTQCKLNR